MPSNIINKEIAKINISKIWILGFIILFLLILTQIMLGKYDEFSAKAIGWFLQVTMPIIILIVTITIYDSRTNKRKKRNIGRRYYNIVIYSSIFYLVLVLFSIIMQPLGLFYNSWSAIDLLELTNIYLGPMQGIIVSLLGIFFYKEE